ncbi:MAG: hypothetical protein Q9211_000575 [Gyalolechia sp. 1 TL-2023]
MASLEPFSLFGGVRPWIPPSWHTSDDRVRGGSSTSSLSALLDNCALFTGHLDIETLGGAGFASQFQSAACGQDNEDSTSYGVWNLSAYDGIEIDVAAADGKVYTLVLKDEYPQDKRDDGRERAGVNWEAEFRLAEDENAGKRGGKTVWIPWSALKATYRGKEKKDAGDIRTSEIKRLGFMIRRYVFLRWPIIVMFMGPCSATLALSKEILDSSYGLCVPRHDPQQITRL